MSKLKVEVISQLATTKLLKIALHYLADSFSLPMTSQTQANPFELQRQQYTFAARWR
jgi:hypothetical protein